MDRFVVRNHSSAAIQNSPPDSECDQEDSECDQEDSDADDIVAIDEDKEIENSASTASGSGSKLIKKRKSYVRKHRIQWEKDFKWLKYDDILKTTCCVCKKSITSKYSHIKRHEETYLHKRNMNKSSNTPKLETFGVKKKLSSLEKQTKISNYKIIMFLHEHNLPFNIMEHFPAFLMSVCPDSNIAQNIQCSRTKATELTKLISQESIEIIVNELKIEKLYSLIIDETTDISTQKSLAVLIRYYDQKSHAVKDKFFGLLRVLDCNAESLFNAVVTALHKHKIPTDDMIGFAADGAAVMMGNKSGVQARLRELNPNLFVLGCTCHSFHLCSSAAASKLPKSIEEFARNIFNHFSNSSKRAEALGEFQQFLNIKPVKMLHPSQTRWLSLQAVVDRVLHSWDALKLYFIDAVLVDNLRNNQQILDNLNTPVVKVYFYFLSYILDIVNRLNTEFQSEHPKIHQLIPNVKELYRTILRNYIKIQILNKENLKLEDIAPSNPDLFLKIDDMYFGARVEQFVSNSQIDENELLKFKTNALAFYIELCVQIKKRFDLKNPLLNYLCNFKPETATSGSVNSITKVLEFIPIIKINDIESLNIEWRLLADIDVIKKKANELSFEEFWEYIFDIKNDLKQFMFPNLTAVVKAIMTLPHSSACAERIFSQLTLLKTK